MFEKEAEKHSKEWFRNNADTNTYETPFTERYCYELGFKDGAEFGYNKAKEQIEKMKCCGNCSKYDRHDRVCSRTKFSVIETLCNCSEDWELRS